MIRGESTCFYMDNGAKIHASHEGDHLVLRVVSHGEAGLTHLDAFQIHPRADNVIELYQREARG